MAIPIILVLIALEAAFSSYKKLQYYKLHDTAGTVGLLAGNILVSLLTQGIILSLYFYLYQFRLYSLNQLVPLWILWLLTIVAIDFVFYWYHRSSHRSRVLWAIHMNHHSSTEMNFSVAFRQAWFGPLSKVPFFMVLPLIGFDPTVTALCGICSTLWGVVGHTQWVDKLGWLDTLFNTPSTHRVHHGTNSAYIDKNYGNLLIIWDRLFGTYAKEKEPVKFGLINNLNTNNPIKITFHTWYAIASDVRLAQSLNDKLGFIFGPPNWQPTRLQTQGKTHRLITDREHM